MNDIDKTTQYKYVWKISLRRANESLVEEIVEAKGFIDNSWGMVGYIRV